MGVVALEETHPCPVCEAPVHNVGGRGRPRIYCTPKCAQQARFDRHAARRAGVETIPVQLVPIDAPDNWTHWTTWLKRLAENLEHDRIWDPEISSGEMVDVLERTLDAARKRQDERRRMRHL